MRATLFTACSIFLTTAVIGNAFYHKKQFYSAVVYLTKSNTSMAVIYLQCAVMLILLGKVMRQIFFGTLRAAELEHLIERAWYAITETLLAFTVFRDDLSPLFVTTFVALLFLKCFHWLSEDRVDFMERSPNINILFHIRILSLLSILSTSDMGFIYFAYHSIITKGPGPMLVFAFEFAILLATILNIVMKYILHWIDISSESPWEEKAVCLLYTELFMSVIKVSLYLVFMYTMLKYHNFPIFAMRPIYLSFRTLKKALSDVIMSRRAIRNMNTLYPDATDEELANTDNVCIICREEMTGNGTAKKLPCNHIFHVTCLRSWFQRQQTCPTCRMDILRIPNSANTGGANQQARPGAAPNEAAAAAAAANAAQGPGGLGAGPNLQRTTQVILQDQIAVVMVQTFAQMFVEAMLTHLQTINLQQMQQQQQQQQSQSQSTQPQQQSSQSSQTIQSQDTESQTDPTSEPPTTTTTTTTTKEPEFQDAQIQEPVVVKETREASTQT